MRRGRVVFDVHPGSSIGLPLADEDLTVGKSFAYCVERFGPRRALVFEGRSWTYDELAADVDRCARALIAAGVGKGTRVGVVLGTRPEFATLAYAIAMVGGVCVLISTFSTDEELDWIVRHSDTSLLVIHSAVRSRPVAHDFVSRHPAVVECARGMICDLSLPYLRRVVVVANDDKALDPRLETWDTFLRGADGCDPGFVPARNAEVAAGDDAILLYTSGSTSVPKAVLHAHRAPTIKGFRMADCIAIGEDDRVWSSFPVFWTAGWVTAIAAPLLVGACAVLQEFYEPHEALALIESERVTCVRQIIHDEMRLVAAHAEHPRDLSSVDVGVVTEALRSLTSVPAGITDLCGWGMTETFTNATMLPLDAPYDLRLATMGRPVPGDRIRIRDRETGAEMATNELGEITVAGMSLMRGYYKADPGLPTDAAGFLPTNDAGFMTPDGLLVFAGRLDRLIKTAGVNVSPVEIEERLLDWGRLGTCAVVGVPHPTLGNAVVLCAARRAADDVSVDEIRSHLRTCLSSFKVPHAVLFLEEAEFPLTANHKIHMPQLREQLFVRLLDVDVDAEWKGLLREQLGHAQ